MLQVCLCFFHRSNSPRVLLTHCVDLKTVAAAHSLTRNCIAPQYIQSVKRMPLRHKWLPPGLL